MRTWISIRARMNLLAAVLVLVTAGFCTAANGQVQDVACHARADDRRRHDEKHGGKDDHREGRRCPAATEELLASDVYGPGRESEDDRPEQRRQEWPQHDDTTDDQE